MPNFIQVSFNHIEPEQSDVLIAHLSEAGYEGFEENSKNLKAFIPEQNFDRALLQQIIAEYNFEFDEQLIPEQNWNEVWESNFQPVVVDDFVFIRADFHEPVAGVEHEIIITPKMSFGTGHHATTYMMMQLMRYIDFKGKNIFDFGTGTGVLAILAEKLGAASVIAIDNDDWSITNTAENLERNQCSAVKLQKAESVTGPGKYDIILANINKNVILDNLSSLVAHLSPNGILLLSGLLEEDEADILKAASSFPVVFNVKQTRNNWLALRFDR